MGEKMENLTFQNLDVKSEYRSPRDDIVHDFYITVLENAVSYKRSVGFFSSSALELFSDGICSLAKNGGQIELVASPYLSAEDEEAIRKGYENRQKIIENALLRNLQNPNEIQKPFAKERLNLLANLIEQNILNIKIAFTENDQKSSIGMYHEKLGIVEDADGNRISFSGSMNESETAFTKNYETIDVFCSWKNDDEKSRVNQKLEAFSRIWENCEKNLRVVRFPKVDEEIFKKYKRGKPDFDLDEKEFMSKSSAVVEQSRNHNFNNSNDISTSSMTSDVKYKINHSIASHAELDSASTKEFRNIRGSKSVVRSEAFGTAEVAEPNALSLSNLPRQSSETGSYSNQFQVNLPSWLHLHEYQKTAIENWKKQNFSGIYDMATGTGKTLTALASLTNLYHEKNGDFCVIILCPYIHLVMQWISDIKEFGIKPIVAFGSSPQKDWKEKLTRAVQKRNFRDDEKGFFCLVSSIATFKRDFVQTQISKFKKKILLIADEAHNLGAKNTLKFLDQTKYEYRLALSATLERHFDDEGTESLYQFFGKKCIEYGLQQAIDEGFLTPYKYFPVVTTLNFEEKEKYLDLSKSIANEVRVDENGKKTLSEKGKMLCIMRSRIIAGAKSKLDALLETIEPYKNQFNLLIYCGATKFNEDEEISDNDENAIRQIDEIVKSLYEKFEMKISKFIAEKSSEERDLIIQNFKDKNIQAIAAIKCLDEGVNIPSIKTAFILASSTNPKEYIQRRGRVLRLSEGKDFAEIYDFICLPEELKTLENKTEEENEIFKSLAAKEVRRMEEFSSLSQNGYESEPLIKKIKDVFKINENTDLEDYEDE